MKANRRGGVFMNLRAKLCLLPLGTALVVLMMSGVAYVQGVRILEEELEHAGRVAAEGASRGVGLHFLGWSGSSRTREWRSPIWKAAARAVPSSRSSVPCWRISGKREMSPA
jgi:hypothetical protein